jgi:hypothetical protein
MKNNLLVLSSALFIGACSTQLPETKTRSNISFLAFGDGGYSVDYPKQKHIDKALSKQAFIEEERKDWLEDYRPIEEFDHAPIHVYPDTQIATEKSGATPVGFAMAKLCDIRPCDFAIQLGDNIYPDGADADDGKDDQKRMNDLILTPLQPLFKQIPGLLVYSALGNHDWKSSRKGVALQTKWMQQQPNFHMDAKGYYSYKIGEVGQDVEFFVLDTNMLLSGQTFYEAPLLADGSEQDIELAIKQGTAELEDIEVHEAPLNSEDKTQLAWLERGLAKSTAKWRIVYGHHILWSIGGSKYSEGHVLRKLLLPSLCHYADAYIAGHEHDLELLTDDCSTVAGTSAKGKLPLIISGAAAKMRGKHTPFAQQQEKRYPQMDLIWSKSFTWGFSYIEVDNQKELLNVEFYTTPSHSDGELVKEQSFTFSRRNQ